MSVLRTPRYLPLLCTAFALLAPSAIGIAQTAPTTDLTVRITGVEADRGGEIRCALFDEEDGFPGDPTRARQGVGATGSGSTRYCRFTNLPAGTYAVSAMHDENGNDELDRSLVGRPVEGWATTRNATPAFRAPRFSESSFSITVDAPTTVDVMMHY